VPFGAGYDVQLHIGESISPPIFSMNGFRVAAKRLHHSQTATSDKAPDHVRGFQLGVAQSAHGALTNSLFHDSARNREL
jgi:hypothetical protein